MSRVRKNYGMYYFSIFPNAIYSKHVDSFDKSTAKHKLP